MAAPSPHQTTPINQLLGENIQQTQMPPAEFNRPPPGHPGHPGHPGNPYPGHPDQHPRGGGNMVTPIHLLQNGGGGGGYGSSGEGVTSKKHRDFLNSVKELDIKTLILIFVLLFVLTTGAFSGFLRSYVPGSVGSDNRVTIVGSFFAATIGLIIAIIASLVMKLI